MKWSILGFVAVLVGCGGQGLYVDLVQGASTLVHAFQPNGFYIYRPNPVQSSNDGTGDILTPAMCGTSGSPRWQQFGTPLPDGTTFFDGCDIPSDRHGGASFGYGTYVQTCFRDRSYPDVIAENEWCEYYMIPNSPHYVRFNDLRQGDHQNPNGGSTHNTWQLTGVYVGDNSIRCHIYDGLNLTGNLVADIGWDTSVEHTLSGDPAWPHNDYSNLRPYTQNADGTAKDNMSMFCKHYAWNQ